jgi:hypothetical protein
MSKDSSLPLVVTLWETHGLTMGSVAARVGEILGIPVYQQSLSAEDIDELAAEEKSRRGAGAARKLATGTPPTELGSQEAEAAYGQLARKFTEVVKGRAGGGGVIQHRSAAFILRDRPNTLHVKLDGIAAKRAERADALADAPRAQPGPRRRIEEEVKAETPRLALQWDPKDIVSYDAIVNTSGKDIEELAQFIAVMARIKGGWPA